MPAQVIVCLTIILAISPSYLTVAGAVVPPSTGTVRIESLAHNAQGPLKAGDKITVTLRGSAGGVATFYIFGAVAGVSMRETRPGVYQAQPALYTGTYTVQPGDAARNAAVLATLRVGNTEAVAVSKRTVTIATNPPVINSFHPSSQERLTNTRPNVVVRFFDPITGVNPTSVRMSVNGKDVSARAAVSETSASYSPDTPFPPGPVRVQVAIANQVKIVRQAEWTFTIVPSTDVIKSVTINPTTVLKAGDVLTVVMTGAPGGEAAFAIAGLQESVPMRESRTPGLYLGSYTPRPQLRLIDAPVVVTLSKEGVHSSTAASVGVTILSGRPPAPTIRAGTEVFVGKRNAAKLLFTGRTVPRARIQAEIAFSTKERLLAADDLGTLGQFSAMADADGNWRDTIGPVIRFPGTKLVVSVVALDTAGQLSPRTTAEVTLP